MQTAIIHWVVPCAWPVLSFIGLIYALRIIQTRRIIRVLPKEGFPADDGGAARVRFWKTEPLRMRQTWKVKAWIWWGGITFIGGIIVLIVCFVIL
jgi:hypothetical protein